MIHIMIKKLIPLFLLPVMALAVSSSEIRLLQESYHQDVIIDNLYKERFSEFIHRTCPKMKLSCQNKLLLKIKDDILIWTDVRLLNAYKKRMDQIRIDDAYWAKVEDYLMTKRELFNESQFVSFIDLSRQFLLLILWKEEHHAFYLIGNDLISSGAVEKELSVSNGEDHYLKTPAGIFTIQSGWRSLGKVLDNNITMPYGQKGRYVFYFGQQTSQRYDMLDANGSKILDPQRWSIIEDKLAFAMHAHKSETYFGKPFSHGCVRMSNELNLFLDNHLVLHKKFLNGKKWTSTSANPPNEPKNYDLAGEYLIIVNTL